MAAAGSRPSVTAAIVGVAGCTLDDAERTLIGGYPWGFILFARNCASPAQVRSLIDNLRAAVGRPDAPPILIDQEGGRVARLCPPHWPARPPARQLGLLAERDRHG